MNDAVARSWAEQSVRRFWVMLFLVGAGFLLTEIVALTGIVPHLKPVSFDDLSANILFAIGFGCPLVLFLSSLPSLSDIVKTAAAGAILALLLWAVHQMTGVSPLLDPKEVRASEWIIGLGLASLGMLAWRAWRSSGNERTTALIYLLPAAVALIYTLEAGIFLYYIKALFSTTYDAYAYAADAAFGGQLSFATGRLFADMPALKAICFIIYVAPPPALVFVYALQVRARTPPPIDVVTVLLVLALAGYGFYFIFPVCGPIFAFGNAFPLSPPPVQELLGRRLTVVAKDAWPNGMPSLHLASVIVAYWHARPYGIWARLAAAVFIIGTFLATLGLGEHYFIDLLVALPFTLAVHAACIPSLPALRSERNAAFVGAGALVAVWYIFLFFGTELLLRSPLLAWGMAAFTIMGVGLLERRLWQAIVRSTSTDAREFKVAPGPRGRFLLGNLLEFRRDVLKLLLDGQRQFGDVVRFRLGPLIVHMVSHPDHIKHVLVTNQHNYNKDTRSSSRIRSITGPGLLTSNGDFWLQQRRLMQPAFHPQRLAAFGSIMTTATAAMLTRWQQHADRGEPLDVASEMMRLTYTIVGKALFGTDVTADSEPVEEAAGLVMEHAYHRLETILDLPEWLPTPRNRRFRTALQTIDRVVYRIIEERQRSPLQAQDLLSLLLHRRDDDTGKGMSDQQLRNETITLLLAGHETTANALTWTWYVLARHPHVASRVREEVQETLHGQPPAVDDLPKLCYTTRVIQEAMRLYPPIWIMERRVLQDDVIGGYHLPAGSTVVLSPFVTHRHLDFWEKPQEFDPDRFLPERSAARPNYAYIPFGGGQRLCIGSNFAMMEAQVIVAMVSQACRLELVPGFAVEPKPGITLRTQHGLTMAVHPHNASSAPRGKSALP